MNIVIEGYAINWANVNCLNRRRNRLHFTNGDSLRLSEADAREIVEAIAGAEPGVAVKITGESES